MLSATIQNIHGDVTAPYIFLVPSPDPSEDIGEYRALWTEEDGAFHVYRRQGVTFGSRTKFPVYEAEKSFNKMLAARDRLRKGAQYVNGSRSRCSLSTGEAPVKNCEVGGLGLNQDDLVSTKASGNVRGGSASDEETTANDDELSESDRDASSSETKSSITLEERARLEEYAEKVGNGTAHADGIAEDRLESEHNLFFAGDAVTQIDKCAHTELSTSSLLSHSEILGRARNDAVGLGIIGEPDMTVEDIYVEEEMGKEIEEESEEDETSTFPEESEPMKGKRDRRYGWSSPILGVLSSLENAPEGLVNPPSIVQPAHSPVGTHHLNYQFSPVFSKSFTPPEISLWAIASAKVKHFNHEPTFSRESIMVSQAAKHVDPVYYTGPFNALKLSGSEMVHAIAGNVYKCYEEVGTWLSDLDGPGEAPLMAIAPRCMYWNSSNAPPLPTPYLLVEKDHRLPDVNNSGESVQPFARKRGTVLGPSPLRKEVFLPDSSDAGDMSKRNPESFENLTPPKKLSDHLGSVETNEESPEATEPSSPAESVGNTPSSISNYSNAKNHNELVLSKLPNLEDCPIDGASMETVNLVNLVKGLKATYNEQRRPTLLPELWLSESVCESQIEQEIEVDNGAFYGAHCDIDCVSAEDLYGTRPAAFLKNHEVQPVKLKCKEHRMLESHSDKGKEEPGYSGDPIMLPGISTKERSAVDMKSSKKELKAANVDGTSKESRGTLEITPEEGSLESTKPCSVKEASCAPEPLAIGKWIYYGTAAIVAGFCIYRHWRR